MEESPWQMWMDDWSVESAVSDHPSHKRNIARRQEEPQAGENQEGRRLSP